MQRRTLLATAGAASLLAACGGGGAAGSFPPTGATTADDPPGRGETDAGRDPGPVGGATDTAAPWVSAYYLGYFWDQSDMQGPQHVDMAAMTHLVFARVAPGGGQMGGAAGEVVDAAGSAGDPEDPFSPGYVAPGDPRNRSVEDYLLERARGAGTRTLLMVGGEGDGPGFAVSTAAATRPAFVRALLDRADRHGYDGFDIDWEDDLDDPAHQAQLLALLRELRQASRGYARWATQPLLLTFPGYPVNINYESVEPWKVEVASLVDQYNLMSYAMAHDEFGWASSHFCPIAGARGDRPMDLATSIQAYVDAGVPRGKMGIGVGFYAIAFPPPVTGPDQALNGARVQSADVEWSWGNLVRRGYLSRGDVHWDAAAGMHYRSYAGGYTGPGGSLAGYLSYEDPDSIAAKADWVRGTGVGGAIVWAINYGSADGVANPLMDAVRVAFRRPRS